MQTNDLNFGDDESDQKYKTALQQLGEPDTDLTDLELGQDEQIQTPMDPFDKLVLNPGRTDKKRVNPVCPDCGEPIRPWANQHERRFICGCGELKEFAFERDS
jgi:ribosomal protein S27AE